MGKTLIRGCSWPLSCLQQFLPILVTLANLWRFAIFRGSPCPFPLLSVEYCEICYSCYFCHICCSIFSHSMKNSCYFCDLCEICGLTEALLDLFSFQVQNFVKFVVLAIFALFVAQPFHIGWKILVIFAIFADISKPFLTFSLSKCTIFVKFVILAIFALFVAQSFHLGKKILVTFAIFAKFADFTKPFLAFSLRKSRILKICYSCYFCHICYSIFSKCTIFVKFVILAIFALFVAQSFHLGKKILVTFAIFAKFADFTKPFLAFSLRKSRILKICYSCYFCHICYSIFSHSKKKASYFCDFCDIYYFFYTFLIAVFFKSFLLKLRKQFASKFLLSRSILDISGPEADQLAIYIREYWEQIQLALS